MNTNTSAHVSEKVRFPGGTLLPSLLGGGAPLTPTTAFAEGQVIVVDSEGVLIEDIIDNLDVLGWAATLQPIPADGRTETYILVRDYGTWLANNGANIARWTRLTARYLKRPPLETRGPFDPAAVGFYLSDVLGWEEVADTAEVTDPACPIPGGVAMRVRHDPLPAARIMLPLATPFDVGNSELWSDLLTKVAALIGVRPPSPDQTFDVLTPTQPLGVFLDGATLDWRAVIGSEGVNAVAVKGGLTGLAGFDPKRRTFDGAKGRTNAIKAVGAVVSVLTQGNRTRIAIQTQNGLVFNSKADAMTRFQSFRLFEETEDAKGRPKVKVTPALEALLTSEDVRIFDGIDCDPSDSLPPHILNTWEGIAVRPVEGDCSRLLKHIKDVLCAGDERNYKVLMGWFAHMFQRPTQKPGFAPVVIGPKGCGKSTVADFIRRGIGRKHSIKISQSKHLTGNFNAHLAGMLFCQAEEVTFGGDKKGEGPLKDAITATTMLTEPKGLDAYQETNFTRFFIVTNPGHAVPASDGERRWFVLQARDLFEGRPLDDPERVAYFNALYEEADNGGIAAFIDYLMNYYIDDFLPFAAPRTKALADQVRRSLGDEDLWVMGLLETGRFDTRDGGCLGSDWPMDSPLDIDCAEVQASYDSHVRRYGGSSGGAGACRAALERHGAVERRRRGSGDRATFYRLGARLEWRERFTARFGIDLAEEAP